MLANLLIGLREGLEAALIVSILLAALTRLGRRELAPSVWSGVAAALALSVGTGLLLQLTSRELPDRASAAFSGTMSLVAVVLVTWMIFWMARRARFLRAHLEGELDRALAGGPWALAAIAFVAVIREGLETALFLWSGATATGGGTVPLLGALVGLLLAGAIGAGLYRGALHLDLARLFRWSGAALVIVAAGVLSYAAGEYAELGWIPGGSAVAFDVSGAIAPDGALAAVLRGLFNFRPITSWPVLIAWAAYLLPVSLAFIARTRRPARTPAPAPTA